MKREIDTNSSILVVDNDPNELKALVIGFKLEGFDAVGAGSSSEALVMLKERRFCAALIDLMMPEMNGLQLARTIRTVDPEVRTVLMSAYHLSPVQLARADTGAVGFVPKPFLFDDLVRFIQNKTTESGSVLNSEKSEFKVRPGGLHIPFDVPKSA